LCQSQQYSFALARDMLKNRVVVGMRAQKRWMEVDSGFQNVPFLKNPRNCHVSPANAGEDVFERIVEALRGQ